MLLPNLTKFTWKVKFESTKSLTQVKVLINMVYQIKYVFPGDVSRGT